MFILIRNATVIMQTVLVYLDRSMFSLTNVFLIFSSSLVFAGDAVIIDASGKSKNADERPPLQEESSKKISVDFEKADIHSVMRFFAHVGNTNIILDDQVQGTVTVRLEGVRWEEAFTAVLWSQGLMATPLNSMYTVSPILRSKP
jgi:type II secretory pathway component GspD/PulD (secretin)